MFLESEDVFTSKLSNIEGDSTGGGVLAVGDPHLFEGGDVRGDTTLGQFGELISSEKVQARLGSQDASYKTDNSTSDMYVAN